MSKGYKFYDPTIKSFFETRNTRFFEEVEFEGRYKVRDFVFEDEFVYLPTVVIDNDQEQTLFKKQIQNYKTML